MATAEVVERKLSARIGEEVSALLGRRRMSDSALARKIGRSHTYVYRRLIGETVWGIDDLEAVAEVLGVGIVDLLPQERRGVSSDGRTTSPYEPTVTGTTPWPDHPIVAGAVSLSLPGTRRPSVPVQPSRADLAERRTAPVGG